MALLFWPNALPLSYILLSATLKKKIESAIAIEP